MTNSELVRQLTQLPPEAEIIIFDVWGVRYEVVPGLELSKKHKPEILVMIDPHN